MEFPANAPSIKAPSFKLRKSHVVVFSASGRYLAQIGARVIIWDTLSRKVVSQFKVIPNESHVAFSDDERTIAVKNTNGELVFCDVLSGRVISRTDKSPLYGEGSRPAFTSDGTQLLDANWNGVLKRVDVATSRAVEVNDFSNRYMFGDIVSNSKLGRFVAVLNAKDGTRGGCKLLVLDAPLNIREPWIVSPTEDYPSLRGGRRWIERIALHPGGEKVALVLDGRGPDEPNSIELLTLGRSELRTITLPSRMHFVRGLAWSASGVVCASVQEILKPDKAGFAAWAEQRASGVHEHLHFYSDATGELIARWPWPDACEVAFSPNGCSFAVASRDIPGAFYASLPARDQ